MHTCSGSSPLRGNDERLCEGVAARHILERLPSEASSTSNEVAPKRSRAELYDAMDGLIYIYICFAPLKYNGFATSCFRFLNEGYRLPKPLINIVGRPMLFWLLDNLKFDPEDTVWLGVQRNLTRTFALQMRLEVEYPSLSIRIVQIDFQTRGAAETLFIMLQVMALAR